MSKSLKKLIDINRLREFKNKLVGTDSPCVQTGAVDQTIAGTKTFSKPIAGSVTGSSGSCTGNSATATNATYANWLRTSSHSDHLFHTEWRSGYFWTYVTAGDGGYRPVRVARSDSAMTADRLTQWYAAYPDGAEAHNAMWGGRDITAAFDSGEFSANIKNGTFKDIFPGDYITKQVTIPKVLADDGATLFDGGTYAVNWVVADCDYWIDKGMPGSPLKAHHVAIVPQAPIFNARMNATNTTEGGYAGSEMYKNVIPACATGIVNAFGSSHILTFQDGISTSVDTSHISSGIPQLTGTPGWWSADSWVSVQCNLMSEKMVYGAPICAAGAMDNTMATRQMSAFCLSELLINSYITHNRQVWWLRDVASSAYFACVGGFGGFAGANVASNVIGVRPFALLV